RLCVFGVLCDCYSSSQADPKGPHYERSVARSQRDARTLSPENPESRESRIPNPKPRIPSSLGASRDIPAVDALVAGAAADPDQAACRARWRVLLILNRRERGRRRRRPRRPCGGGRSGGGRERVAVGIVEL